MKNEIRPLMEVQERAVRALERELGVVDTIRFLSQFTTGQGDYTESRRQDVEALSLDDIMAAVHKARSST